MNPSVASRASSAVSLLKFWRGVALGFSILYMSTFISERFIIEYKDDEFEIFVNEDKEVFIGNVTGLSGSWFLVNKEEWDELKKFIDNKIQ